MHDIYVTNPDDLGSVLAELDLSVPGLSYQETASEILARLVSGRTLSEAIASGHREC